MSAVRHSKAEKHGPLLHVTTLALLMASSVGRGHEAPAFGLLSLP
jgi:hypothetical protein